MTQTGSAAARVVGWIFLGVAFASAAAILWDILGRGQRQQMAVMNWVWPITALYWGPVASWFYFRGGKRFANNNWWPVAKGTSHCGAGCTLGDICAEWLVFAAGWAFAFTATHKVNVLFTTFIFDFVFAWTLGVVFQYFTIVPMRENVGKLEGIWLAIKADTLSIVSFQVGLFGFMAIYHLLFWDPPLTVASPTYWWMMQIGMIVGFFTSWPVNAWLIKRGWKEKM